MEWYVTRREFMKLPTFLTTSNIRYISKSSSLADLCLRVENGGFPSSLHYLANQTIHRHCSEIKRDQHEQNGLQKGRNESQVQ